MKVKHTTTLLIAICTAFLMIISCSGAFGTSLAKITLKVINEEGIPVQDAKVGAAFMIYTKGGWGSTSKHIEGNTNTKGIFEGSAIADNIVDFSVRKDGYYVSFGT